MKVKAVTVDVRAPARTTVETSSPRRAMAANVTWEKIKSGKERKQKKSDMTAANLPWPLEGVCASVKRAW